MLTKLEILKLQNNELTGETTCMNITDASTELVYWYIFRVFSSKVETISSSPLTI